MSDPQPPIPQQLVPQWIEASSQLLSLESTLGELTLHDFAVDSQVPAIAVAQAFERYPHVPGVIVLEEGHFLGMVSRSRFLEYLLRPQGIDLFLSHSLGVLYSYARLTPLLLSTTTPILQAAQRALRRSSELQREPLVVQNGSTFYVLDVHELNLAYWQMRGIETQCRFERLQTQMIQAEKMASLGRLVDGVAHEILDPVSFIWGNLSYVSEYAEQLLTVIDLYQHQSPQLASIEQLQQEIEIDYLREDLPKAIASIRTGAARLKQLAMSLQTFCHIDDVYPKPADLHSNLEGILLLLKSRLTPEIHITRQYGHLPPVTCYIGQLSQVFINILSNAIDAILNQSVQRDVVNQLGQSDTVSSRSAPPEIRIATQVIARSPTSDHAATERSQWVSIRIANNGAILTPAQRQAIDVAFSTNRQTVAKETSLAVSYQIVTAKHGGHLYVYSPSPLWQWSSHTVLDGGTEFEILLPLHPNP